jgi:hypothetical protein
MEWRPSGEDLEMAEIEKERRREKEEKEKEKERIWWRKASIYCQRDCHKLNLKKEKLMSLSDLKILSSAISAVEERSTYFFPTFH